VTLLGGVVATAWGFAIGAAYFVGLWWTVSRVGRWRRPGTALAISFVLRFMLLLGGLALLLHFGFFPLALGLVGLLLARLVVTLLLRPTARGAPPPAAAAPDTRQGGAA
jgi:F1F0 ATPase subunit 2